MCHLVANGMLARGPIHGRHVSLVDWFKIFATAGLDPATSGLGEETWEGLPTGAPPYEPYYIYEL
jgi:hypothetical protein